MKNTPFLLLLLSTFAFADIFGGKKPLPPPAYVATYALSDIKPSAIFSMLPYDFKKALPVGVRANQLCPTGYSVNGDFMPGSPYDTAVCIDNTGTSAFESFTISVDGARARLTLVAVQMRPRRISYPTATAWEAPMASKGAKKEGDRFALTLADKARVQFVLIPAQSALELDRLEFSKAE